MHSILTFAFHMNFTWDLTNFTLALPTVGPGAVAPPLYINSLCIQVLLESLQKANSSDMEQYKAVDKFGGLVFMHGIYITYVLCAMYTAIYGELRKSILKISEGVSEVF